MKYAFVMSFFLNLSVAHASENLPANPWASGTNVMNVSEEYQRDSYTDFKNKLADTFSDKEKPENQVIVSIKPIKPYTTETKTEVPTKIKESERLTANPWATGQATMNVSEKYQTDYYTDFKNRLANVLSTKKEPDNQVIISIKPIKSNKQQNKTELQTTKKNEQKPAFQNNAGLLSMFDSLRAIGYNIPKKESSEMNFTRFLPNDVSLPNNLSYVSHIREMVQDFEKNSGFNIHDTLQQIMK